MLRRALVCDQNSWQVLLHLKRWCVAPPIGKRHTGIGTMQSGTLFLIAISILSLAGCSTIDRHPERTASAAFSPSPGGVLATVDREAEIRLPTGHSGFHLVPEAEEALNWRLALADHATRSIDIQYYLWYTDESGTLLLSP